MQKGMQKDMQKTLVSFAIVSDHLPSFSILSMDSYDMERRGGERVRREEGGGRREFNMSGHDTSPDGKGYHIPAGKGLFEPRWT